MSRSRAKGTAAETAVVRWLHSQGFPFAERRALHGANDCGDIAGIPGAALEIKNCNRLELAAWMDEAHIEGSNANASVYAVIHKRKGKGDVGQWYATMPAVVFAELLRVWTEQR